MASIGSPTDEAPLHPEIHSIVSLATAHAQKVYFSGPVRYSGPGVSHPREVWAQLTGTVLGVKKVNKVGQEGEEIPQSPVNIADGVRPPLYLRYLCDSTKPSSIGRRYQRIPEGDQSPCP